MTQAQHEAIKAAVRVWPGSDRSLASALGVNWSTFQHWREVDEMAYGRMDARPDLYDRIFAAFREKGYELGFTEGQKIDPDVPVEDEAEVDGDTLKTITNVGEPVHSLEDAVEHFEVDTSVWYAKRWKCQSHEGPIKVKADGEEKALKVVYYKVWVQWERSPLREGLQSFVDALLEDETPPEEDLPGPRPVRGDLLSVIHIPDLHLGNIIYEDTAGAAWDLEEGVAQYKRAFSYLLEKAVDTGAGQIGLVIGSDAAQANGTAATSANGTQYTQTAPAKLVFRAMGRMYIWSIKQALRHCEVIAWGVSGNHDYDPADNCAVGLSWKFEDVRHVTIDASPNDIKCHRHGKTFIGLAHGKTNTKKKWKAQDYYNYFTERHSDLWHATTYREVLAGHVHSRSASRPGDYITHHSLLLRVSAALCPPTAWEVANNYIGALRAAEVNHYHPEMGLYGHHPYAPELMEA